MKTKTKIPIPLFLIVLILALTSITGLSPKAQAVSPAPDGCYPGFTTKEGCNALQFLTSGAGNTGLGWYSLFSAGAANYNTGVGAGTLVLNTADSNTAVGAAALLLNTSGTENTAVGTDALVVNDSGGFNDAFGVFALGHNTDGAANVAVGDSAFAGNVHGSYNTAIGYLAGVFVEGTDNIYIGATVADSVASESGTIRIGDPPFVSACFIAGIVGQAATGGSTVFVDANGKLGTVPAGSPLSMNEMLKEHRLVQELKATTEKQAARIALQDAQIKALTAGLQKVSAQLEVSKPSPRTVLNNQ
jgi:hypothetical protein